MLTIASFVFLRNNKPPQWWQVQDTSASHALETLGRLEMLCEKAGERDNWRRNPQSPEQLEVVTNYYIPNRGEITLVVATD